MPLENVSRILREADKKGYGIVAFNAFNYESIAWLIETAEEEKTPVIVMMYPAIYRYIPFSSFTAITRDLASKVTVPVGLHFDHSSSFEQIQEGIRDGFTSLMIDGSAMEFEDNISITRQVAAAAHIKGLDVEAELGRVGSASNLNDFTDASNYTDPEKAVEFVKRTGVDSLAVSIGSAHGNYVKEPKLDFKRLEEINSAIGIPLVLHGGTGIPEDQIKKAVKLGINKLNVGTEFNQIFYKKMKETILENKSREDCLSCMSAFKNEIKDYIRAKINLLKP